MVKRYVFIMLLFVSQSLFAFEWPYDDVPETDYELEEWYLDELYDYATWQELSALLRDPVELNTAELNELLRVPGITKKIARDIIAARKKEAFVSYASLESIPSCASIIRLITPFTTIVRLRETHGTTSVVYSEKYVYAMQKLSYRHYYAGIRFYNTDKTQVMTEESQFVFDSQQRTTTLDGWYTGLQTSTFSIIGGDFRLHAGEGLLTYGSNANSITSLRPELYRTEYYHGAGAQASYADITLTTLYSAHKPRYSMYVWYPNENRFKRTTVEDAFEERTAYAGAYYDTALLTAGAGVMTYANDNPDAPLEHTSAHVFMRVRPVDEVECGAETVLQSESLSYSGRVEIKSGKSYLLMRISAIPEEIKLPFGRYSETITSSQELTLRHREKYWLFSGNFRTRTTDTDYHSHTVRVTCIPLQGVQLYAQHADGTSERFGFGGNLTEKAWRLSVDTQRSTTGSYRHTFSIQRRSSVISAKATVMYDGTPVLWKKTLRSSVSYKPFQWCELTTASSTTWKSIEADTAYTVSLKLVF